MRNQQSHCWVASSTYSFLFSGQILTKYRKCDSEISHNLFAQILVQITTISSFLDSRCKIQCHLTSSLDVRNNSLISVVSFKRVDTGRHLGIFEQLFQCHGDMVTELRQSSWGVENFQCQVGLRANLIVLLTGHQTYNLVCHLATVFFWHQL